jgi:enoyl-CoA hydratase/carnithine racemase
LGWPVLELLRAFDELPMPIVAAVHGVCVGGGLEMALACDLIIASESARIGSVEATVGLHPLAGGIQRVAQRAGAARAKEMAMLGRRYDARTLERWNVINRVVADEQLAEAAATLARELAGGPTVAPRGDEGPGHDRHQRGRRRRRHGNDRAAEAHLPVGGLSSRGRLVQPKRPRYGQL